MEWWRETVSETYKPKYENVIMDDVQKPPRPPPPIFRAQKPMQALPLVPSKPAVRHNSELPRKPPVPKKPESLSNRISGSKIPPEVPNKPRTPQNIPPKPLCNSAPSTNPPVEPAVRPTLKENCRKEQHNSHQSNHNIHFGFGGIRTVLAKLAYTPEKAPPQKKPVSDDDSDTDLNNNNYPKLSPSGEKCLICRDFSSIDAHAATFPRSQVRLLRDLAEYLTLPFFKRIDKARAIFIWLHHNISYDTESFFSGNIKRKSPEETIVTGLAVCQGYAELFQTLGELSGLQVKVISGDAKGYGYKELPEGSPIPKHESNHAWNAVKLDSGRWHLVDPCWGAGHLDKSNQYVKCLNTKYFTATAEIFRRNHFPTNKKYQFCPQVMSWEEYSTMRNALQVLPVTMAKTGLSGDTIRPPLEHINANCATQFLVTAACEHSPIRSRNQYVLILSVDGVFTPFKEQTKGLVWTCEHSGLRKGSNVILCYVDTLNHMDAKGVGVQAYLNSTKPMSWKPYTFGAICNWTVV